MFKYFSVLLISANSERVSRMPIAIRSFHPKEGVQFKAIGVVAACDEHADRAFNMLTESLKNVGLACENMSGGYLYHLNPP